MDRISPRSTHSELNLQFSSVGGSGATRLSRPCPSLPAATGARCPDGRRPGAWRQVSSMPVRRQGRDRGGPQRRRSGGSDEAGFDAVRSGLDESVGVQEQDRAGRQVDAVPSRGDAGPGAEKRTVRGGQVCDAGSWVISRGGGRPALLHRGREPTAGVAPPLHLPSWGSRRGRWAEHGASGRSHGDTSTRASGARPRDDAAGACRPAGARNLTTSIRPRLAVRHSEECRPGALESRS